MNQELFLRPRFSLTSEKTQERILEDFAKTKDSEGQTFRIKVVDTHIFIDISEEESHFWSPQLHLEILEVEENKVKVKGIFGPKPQVWTFFMFLHFVVGVVFIGSAVWTYVNYSLEKSLMLPILLLIILPMVWILLYFVGRLGRDFGKNQIKKMQQFLLQVLES